MPHLRIRRATAVLSRLARTMGVPNHRGEPLADDFAWGGLYPEQGQGDWLTGEARVLFDACLAAEADSGWRQTSKEANDALGVALLVLAEQAGHGDAELEAQRADSACVRVASPYEDHRQWQSTKPHRAVGKGIMHLLLEVAERAGVPEFASRLPTNIPGLRSRGGPRPVELERAATVLWSPPRVLCVGQLGAAFLQLRAAWTLWSDGTYPPSEHGGDWRSFARIATDALAELGAAHGLLTRAVNGLPSSWSVVTAFEERSGEGLRLVDSPRSTGGGQAALFSAPRHGNASLGLATTLLVPVLAKRIPGFVALRDVTVISGRPLLVPGSAELRVILEVDLDASSRDDGSDYGRVVVAQRFKGDVVSGKTFAEMTSVGVRIPDGACLLYTSPSPRD